MKDFLNDYAKNRKICTIFLKKRFNNAPFTDGDYEDIVSTAVEKMLTRPNLLPNLATLLYVAHLSAIDLFRKRRRETLVGDFPTNAPLSMWDNDDIELKNRIEEVILAVSRLNPRRRNLMELKYHAYAFESTTSCDEMVEVKNQPRPNSQQMAVTLGFPSAIALRQETFRTVAQLRMRFAA